MSKLGEKPPAQVVLSALRDSSTPETTFFVFFPITRRGFLVVMSTVPCRARSAFNSYSSDTLGQ